MRNVADLAWEYEKKVPALAEKHTRIQAAAAESWKQAAAHSGYARDWMEWKIGAGRELLEEWVRKGR
jgi:organizing structure protein 2